MAEKDFITNFDRMYILHVSSNKKVQERLISSILSGILDIFDDTDIVAEIKPYIDYGSMGLEKAIIKQCYPDFTDGEINAYTDIMHSVSSLRKNVPKLFWQPRSASEQVTIYSNTEKTF